MAAGVHHALIAGGIRQSGGLRDRQRIHVGAQADAPLRRAARQRRDHAMAADPGMEGNAELGQLLLDEGGGRLFLQREFRIGVQMAPPVGEFLVKVRCHDARDVGGQRRFIMAPCTTQVEFVTRMSSIRGGEPFTWVETGRSGSFLSQNLVHRFALRQLIDQFVQVANFPHRWLLDVLHTDTANHAFDQRT